MGAKFDIDAIARAVFSAFKSIPERKHPKEHEWTMLAGLVVHFESITGEDDYECVSFATGTKCLGRRDLCPSGRVINDCHAEVLARRALNARLLLEIQYHLEHCDPTLPCRLTSKIMQSTVLLKHSVVENHTQSKIEARNTGKSQVSSPKRQFIFQWNERYSLCLYISDSPCGDASMYSDSPDVDHSISSILSQKSLHVEPTNSLSVQHSATNAYRRTGAKPTIPSPTEGSPSSNAVVAVETIKTASTGIGELPLSNEPPEVASQHMIPTNPVCCLDDTASKLLEAGVLHFPTLRTKSGRSDLPYEKQTLSHCCSDKICKWIAVGMQNALVSHFVPAPIRLSAIVVSAETNVVPSIFNRKIQSSDSGEASDTADTSRAGVLHVGDRAGVVDAIAVDLSGSLLQEETIFQLTPRMLSLYFTLIRRNADAFLTVLQNNTNDVLFPGGNPTVPDFGGPINETKQTLYLGITKELFSHGKTKKLEALAERLGVSSSEDIQSLIGAQGSGAKLVPTSLSIVGTDLDLPTEVKVSIESSRLGEEAALATSAGSLDQQTNSEVAVSRVDSPSFDENTEVRKRGRDTTPLHPNAPPKRARMSSPSPYSCVYIEGIKGILQGANLKKHPDRAASYLSKYSIGRFFESLWRKYLDLVSTCDEGNCGKNNARKQRHSTYASAKHADTSNESDSYCYGAVQYKRRLLSFYSAPNLVYTPSKQSVETGEAEGQTQREMEFSFRSWQRKPAFLQEFSLFDSLQ